ncbi:MAG: family 20 glycosylhydrolase [Eubacteriales bacterium]
MLDASERIINRLIVLILIIAFCCSFIACEYGRESAIADSPDENALETQVQEDKQIGDNAKENSTKSDIVIGIHTMVFTDDDLEALTGSLPQLADMGINLVIVEVGYYYQYESHPEFGEEADISFTAARRLSEKAKELGIKIAPGFNCLGHQSWGRNTSPLLTVYPELDETPGKYKNNVGIYCRSWCPLNEDVNPIIFDLIDELMDAFDTQAFHVGMDEVFIIGDEDCPRCSGRDAGELFAKQVNDLYKHIVIENGGEMYMWADRLLDGAALDDVYSEWESSYNGTYTAIDLIPKDIILCDWHYDALEDYPSIDYLVNAGFRVLTASWNDIDATEKLIIKTMQSRQENDRVLGHIYTTWEISNIEDLAEWGPMGETIDLLK